MPIVKICPVLIVSFAAAALAGCSSSDGGAPGPTGSAKTGITDCGHVSCQAGSHCEDERYSQCNDGCTTDNNCPGDQKCAGRVCQNGAVPGGPAMGCQRVAEADGVCAKASLPRNAYHCTNTSPPDMTCKLAPDQDKYPGGYCCPH